MRFGEEMEALSLKGLGVGRQAEGGKAMEVRGGVSCKHIGMKEYSIFQLACRSFCRQERSTGFSRRRVESTAEVNWKYRLH